MKAINMLFTENLALTEKFASPETRRALFSLCYSQTQDRDSAQDLVQETLFEALRRAETLPRPESWRPWLFGVARNVCRRWREAKQQEMRRISHAATVDGALGDEPEDCLNADELSSLLDKAMRFLSEDSRQIVEAVYLKGMSHTEAAARFGLSPNMIAVRLHRCHKVLRRVLTSDPSLRDLAANYGFLVAGEGALHKTPLWCRWCGRNQLHAQLQYSDATGAEGYLSHVDLFCPECNRGRILLADATTRNAAFVLDKVKGCKPALNRLNRWWGDMYGEAVAGKWLSCHQCGKRRAQMLPAPTARPVIGRTRHPIYIYCSACHGELFASPSGIAIHSPELQHFSQTHTRHHILPEQEVSLEGRPALLIQFRSLTSSGQLNMFLDRETFKTLAVETL